MLRMIILKKDYPNILITTSLSDSRVLFDEPAKFCAKLRTKTTGNNLLLLKTEMEAGHGSRTGRKNIIEDIAFDYAFALKISGKTQLKTIFAIKSNYYIFLIYFKPSLTFNFKL